MIKEVTDLSDAALCDEFLTELITEEAKYDKTLDKFTPVKDYFTKLNNSNNYLLGYYDNDKIVAYLYLKEQKDEMSSKLGYLIDGLYVLKPYRNKGIATSLIKESIKIAKEKNATYIDINVMYQNETAKKLYKSLNFQELRLGLRTYL